MKKKHVTHPPEATVAQHSPEKKLGRSVPPGGHVLCVVGVVAFGKIPGKAWRWGHGKKKGPGEEGGRKEGGVGAFILKNDIKMYSVDLYYTRTHCAVYELHRTAFASRFADTTDSRW